MKEKSVSYYLIRGELVAKREQDGQWDRDYLFRDGRWVEDDRRVVAAHLTGFAPSEPEDSPCRFGSTEIPAEMDRISEEQAVSMMNRQILEVLKSRWKAAFAARKEEWDKKPRWPAKYVRTKFLLNGVEYSLFPTDIGLTHNNWDQGFMESVQSEISEDLEAYGATDIHSMGFID